MPRLPRLVATSLLALAACTMQRRPPASAPADEHAGHDMAAMSSAAGSVVAAGPQQAGGLPAGAADARARLDRSPRHGEWVMIPTGGGDSVRTWVVYPERSTKAPVVVVVHEIFGLSTWIRAVADQLAADGYIALAPDLLTGKLPANIDTPDSIDAHSQDAVAAIRTLDPGTVQRNLDAVARYGMALPAALPKYGIVGFCWGGSTVFMHAVHAPTLGAAVVYYGTSPPADSLAKVRAPVLGLYGGNDMRVDATIPPADSTMKRLGKVYEHEVFEGAGHGFLRAQDGQNGANLAAARRAWPMTIDWFRKNLGR